MSALVDMVDPRQVRDWDRLVRDHDEATVFHGAGWARMLQKAYGFKPLYVVQQAGNHLDGVLPLMEADSWLTGKKGVSLPFADYSSPLLSSSGSFEALLDEVMSYGRRNQWKYAEFKCGDTFPVRARPSCAYVQHGLSLSEDEDRLLAGCRGPVRTAIRKAQRAGVRVERSQSKKSLREYYGLHCRARRRQGLPPQPYAFFLALHEHLLSEDRGFIAKAYVDEVLVAGVVFLHFGSRAVYKYGASDKRYQHLRANNLVMWEALRWCAQSGFKHLSLGRTNLEHEGLRRFKLGWGCDEQPLEYYKYDFRQQAFTESKDRVSGWHNRVFRLMPIPVSRAVGALLYGHMV